MAVPQQTIVVQQNGTPVYTGSPSSKLATYGGVQNQQVFQAAVCVPQMPGNYLPAPQPLFDAVDKSHAVDKNTGSPNRAAALPIASTRSPTISPSSAARLQRGAVALPSPVGQEWTVKPMKHGAKLGAELGTMGSELFVVKITDGGRLEAWNRERPDKAVMPGDRIVQVNGRKGNSETLMSVLESMHSEDQLEFVMRRGGAFAAHPGPVRSVRKADERATQVQRAAVAKTLAEQPSCVDGLHGVLRSLLGAGR